MKFLALFILGIVSANAMANSKIGELDQRFIFSDGYDSMTIKKIECRRTITNAWCVNSPIGANKVYVSR